MPRVDNCGILIFMQEIIARACMLVAIILLGYVLRRIRFLPEEAFAVVSKTVLNVTLPCAVITNFAHIQVTSALLWMFPLGFLVNALLVGTGYLTGKRRGMDEQVFCMLNFSGHNIGCFALPYVASLLGPTAVVSVCLFDAGNAIWATGGTNALCAAMQEGGRIRLGAVAKRISRSVTTITYLAMLLLATLNLRLPGPVLEFAGLVGSANSFLAMFMLGLGMNLKIRRAQLRWIGKAFVLRFGISALLAAAFYFLLPFEHEIRLGAALAVFAPISSISAAYTGERGGDVGLASSWNTITILSSLVCMTVVLLLAA